MKHRSNPWRSPFRNFYRTSKKMFLKITPEVPFGTPPAISLQIPSGFPHMILSCSHLDVYIGIAPVISSQFNSVIPRGIPLAHNIQHNCQDAFRVSPGNLAKIIQALSSSIAPIIALEIPSVNHRKPGGFSPEMSGWILVAVLTGVLEKKNNGIYRKNITKNFGTSPQRAPQNNLQIWRNRWRYYSRIY